MKSLLCLWSDTIVCIVSLVALFSKDDNCKLPAASPTFSGPLVIYWEEQKTYLVSEIKSDMGSGVRHLLFNGQRHIGLRAACWDQLLLLSSNSSQIHKSTSDQIYALCSTYEVSVVYIQQVKAYQRGVLSITGKELSQILPKCCSGV